MQEFAPQENKEEIPVSPEQIEQGGVLDDVESKELVERFLNDKFKEPLSANGFESISIFPAQAENGGNAVGVYFKEVSPKNEEMEGDNPFNVLDSMVIVDIDNARAKNPYKLQDFLVDIITKKLQK